MKLLKLLIALEEFEMAAEGFAVMKVRLVASRLCLWALCKMCVDVRFYCLKRSLRLLRTLLAELKCPVHCMDLSLYWGELVLSHFYVRFHSRPEP
jgi:hypothetical protein